MYSICIIWIAFVPIYFGTTAAAGTKASPKNNYKVTYLVPFFYYIPFVGKYTLPDQIFNSDFI